MKTVTLKMEDLLTGNMIERTIDATNAYSNGSESWELKNEASQRRQLERWITERGNEQHDALLILKSWVFNN